MATFKITQGASNASGLMASYLGPAGAVADYTATEQDGFYKLT